MHLIIKNHHIRKARKAESSKSLDSRHADILMMLVRLVCRATEANNNQLSSLLLEVVTAIGAQMDTEMGTLCMSTEEMLHEIDALNNRTDIKDLVVYTNVGLPR